MKKAKIYSALVLMHPINRKGCFEILFSRDGKRYSSIDGNGPEYFRQNGMTTACRFELKPQQFYKLMAKSLDIKIRTIDLHTKYKDYTHRIQFLRELAVGCVNAQCKYNDDLDLPESVITLANTLVISPIR